MRVRICYADQGGCGFYRLIAPATVLREKGMDIVFDELSKGIVAHRDSEGRITSIDPTGDDVIVIQRPMFLDIVPSIPLIQANGTKVVVELDDDFWSVDNRSLFHKVKPNFNSEYLTEACKLADLVTVSTPALAELIPNKNVRVLRNCVPAYYLAVTPDYGTGETPEGTIIGWTGNTSTHVGDLEVMGDSLRRSIRKHGARFLNIGSSDAWEIAGLDEQDAFYSDWIDFRNYIGAVKVFDYGIVPLRMSRFNECKSYLKGLEYAALGIPFVASPTGEYKYMASKGVGLLAEHKHDWFKQLDRLLTSDNAELIESGRAFARLNTYEHQAWRWSEAWASVLA